MDFSTIEITSKKVRGNDVDFLISKITSKKLVEMTWKFFEIGLRRIDVISTLNQRRSDVERPLGPISYVKLNVLNFFPCWTLLLLILFLISSLFFVRTFCLHYDSDFRLDFISDSNLNATISKAPDIVRPGIDFETISCVYVYRIGFHNNIYLVWTLIVICVKCWFHLSVNMYHLDIHQMFDSCPQNGE